ncbi:rhomboid family intramembrane serine protease [Polyangium aurulentum]|uniref:rhomboid family intramembrane serine protease n=1 Tax=Polyangium aurulentum TaxID=2567896 RepID=UPI0010AE2D3B|nr:rhomboid family intramembrane serine protease [Polyangium aurulentum]UQA54718.1 rhomboid family intramembrane serine protease [Polyangium aurulentum]
MNEIDLPSRVASGLLAASRAANDELRLVHEDAHVATYSTQRSKKRVVLVTAGPAVSSEELSARLATVVQANNRTFGPEAHIVLIGGGEEVAGLVDGNMPRLMLAQINFHQVDAAGEVRTIAGSGLPWLHLIHDGAAAGAEPLGEDVTKEAAPERPRFGIPQDQQMRIGGPTVVTGMMAPRYTVTAIVSVVCIALMGLAHLWGDDRRLTPVLIRMGANTPGTFEDGELYRLFASAFLHGNVPHLVMNMFAVYAFGPMLEGLLGSKRYTILYAVSALGGSLASVLVRSGPFSSVGASGAIWGLMAAGLGVTYWPRGLLPEVLAQGMRRRILMTLGINAAYSLMPGIDMQAHVGGGVAGFVAVALLGYGLVPVAERTSNDDIEVRGRWTTRILAAVSVLVMGASVIMALAAGRPWESGKPPVFARTPVGDTGLSAELPTVVAAHPMENVKPLSNLQILSYGEPAQSPVVVEFVVYRLDAAVPPDGMQQLMEELREEAQTSPPENLEVHTPPKRVELEGRPAIFVEYRLKKDIPVRSYALLVGDRVVTVRGYIQDDGATAWKDVERRIAASVRADDAP